jgi:uncharacterized protein YgiM (DUF1202 family)
VAYDHETDSYISPRLAKRRKHQKAAFWVFFTIAVLIAVGAAAALLGGGDSGDSGTSGVAAGATTLPGQSTLPGASVTTSVVPNLPATTVKRGKPRGVPTTTVAPSVLPPPKAFKVVAATGVNVRQGPGLNYPVAGTIEDGNQVSVVCVIDGDSINGPGGATTKWVRIEFDTLKGYVSAAYVAAGAALNDPAQLGPCPSV